MITDPVSAETRGIAITGMTLGIGWFHFSTRRGFSRMDK